MTDCRNYANYTLYRGTPVNENHLEFFENLTEKYDVNFWRMPGQLFKPVEFIITPEDHEKFEKEAEEKGIYLTTLMGNVQR
jgi:hypothetical protein